MYKLHICNAWDVDGLVSTSIVMEGTREECWAEHDKRMEEESSELYLVEKPDWSDCTAGYPTRWDDTI